MAVFHYLGRARRTQLRVSRVDPYVVVLPKMALRKVISACDIGDLGEESQVLRARERLPLLIAEGGGDQVVIDLGGEVRFLGFLLVFLLELNEVLLCLVVEKEFDRHSVLDLPILVAVLDVHYSEVHDPRRTGL